MRPKEIAVAYTICKREYGQNMAHPYTRCNVRISIVYSQKAYHHRPVGEPVPKVGIRYSSDDQ